MRFSAAALLLFAAMAHATSAQTPPGPPRPGVGFVMPVTITSPEVAADGKVTFRLWAPNAKDVAVSGLNQGMGQRPLPMQRDDRGVWSVITETLKPDIYEYSFVVDGLRTNDPSNTRARTGYASVNRSLVLVPGANAWTPRANVEGGAVSRHAFHSTIAGDDREYVVYTPAGYDPTRKEPYPVLYLLHGLFDETRAWVDVGAANVILDNLIADGQATPMLVVNTLGYGNADGPAGHRREDMLPNFGRILIEEVLPRVEQRYHVSRQPAGRAIAGLSMGGAEATLVGLNHLDTFAWIGSFSGAYNLWPLTRPADSTDPTTQPPRPGAMPRIELEVAGLPKSYPGLDRSSNSRIRLLWIACGTADVLIGANRQFKQYLDTQGVKVTYTETPDIGHVWPFWRQSLVNFVPLLFK